MSALQAISTTESMEERAGVTQLLLDIDIKVGDESIVKRVTRVWHFGDSGAIQTYGTDGISFNESTDSVVVTEAATLTPDGHRIPFDAQQAEIIDSSTYHVFTHAKEAVISFPGLEVGSLAILQYEVIVDRNRLEAGWSQITFPQNVYPRTRFNLNVRWNVSPQMEWKSTSEFVTCDSDDHSVTCTGRNIPPAESDYEVDWGDQLGQVVVGDASSWSGVTGVLRRSFDSALENSRGIDELAVGLTAAATSVEEKISSIHRFVARDVRYVSMSKYGHSTVPHPIAETLENRFGDCKDKSALLVALLDRVGVDAVPVLVATDRSDPNRLGVPAAGYFDHMVVCFNHAEERRCLDATDSHTDWRHTSAWIQGRVSLDLSPNAVPATIPASLYRWGLDVESEIRFTDAGGQQEHQRRIYRSEYAGTMRGSLSGMTVTEVDRWLLDQYQEVVADSVEPTFELTGLEDLGPTLEVSSKVEFKPLVPVDEDLSYGENDAWIRYLINSLTLKNRTYAVAFAGVRVNSVYTLDISSRWEVDGTNASLELTHEFGSMSRTVTREGDGVVRVSTRLEIPSRLISAARAKEFNAFLGLLKRESYVRVYGRLK